MVCVVLKHPKTIVWEAAAHVKGGTSPWLVTGPSGSITVLLPLPAPQRMTIVLKCIILLF